jgi:hypothetical protein
MAVTTSTASVTAWIQATVIVSLCRYTPVCEKSYTCNPDTTMKVACMKMTVVASVTLSRRTVSRTRNSTGSTPASTKML